MKVFRETYGVKAGSALGKAYCAVCHTSVGKGDKLNPYGEAIAGVLTEKKTRQLTKEMLASIEELDSDGDGVANGDEITADSLPGDAKSTPSREWKVAVLAPIAGVDKVADLLAAVKPRALRAGGVKLEELKVALTDTALAIDAKVFDRAITPQTKEWTATSLGLATATADGKTMTRLLFTPKSVTGGDVQLVSANAVQAAPNIAWQVKALTPCGYELTALIPFTALHLDARAKSMAFEATVQAAPAAEGGAKFAALFGGAKDYQTADHFGALVPVAEKPAP